MNFIFLLNDLAFSIAWYLQHCTKFIQRAPEKLLPGPVPSQTSRLPWRPLPCTVPHCNDGRASLQAAGRGIPAANGEKMPTIVAPGWPLARCMATAAAARSACFCCCGGRWALASPQHVQEASAGVASSVHIMRRRRVPARAWLIIAWRFYAPRQTTAGM